MKIFASIICLLWSFAAKSQSSIFCVQVNCPQTITAPTDSALLFGAATITIPGDTVTGFTWKQVSGPTTAILITPTSSQTMVRKLVPGSYLFSMTATTKMGNIQTVGNDVITVLPAPAPPRTVISVAFKLINGVWIPSFVYNDGSTQ